MKILKTFFHDNAVFKPGMEQHFLATRPTKARQRELKKKGKIDFDEAVPVAKSKTETEKSNPEKEE